MTTTADKCACGSADLFSGWFDADDLAHPVNVGDPTPDGVRWTTFCNQCGSEVKPRKGPKPKKQILFAWLGGTPVGFAPPELSHRVQCSCWVVAPSKAAFRRLTDLRAADMPWVSEHEVTPATPPPANKGAQLAAANPGVVYFRDEFNHTPAEDVWLIHPNAGRTHA